MQSEENERLLCECSQHPDAEWCIPYYINMRLSNRFQLSGRNSMRLTGRPGRHSMRCARLHTRPRIAFATVALNSPALDSGEYLRSLRSPDDMLRQFQDPRWPLLVDRLPEGGEWDGYNVSAGPIGFVWEWKLHPVRNVYVKWGSGDYDGVCVLRALFARDRLPALRLIMSQSITNPGEAYYKLSQILLQDHSSLRREHQKCVEQYTHQVRRTKFLEENNFTGFWDGDEYNQRDIASSKWKWRMRVYERESKKIACLWERVRRLSALGTPLPDLSEPLLADE
jgi:hypothetical protein